MQFINKFLYYEVFGFRGNVCEYSSGLFVYIYGKLSSIEGVRGGGFDFDFLVYYVLIVYRLYIEGFIVD